MKYEITTNKELVHTIEACSFDEAEDQFIDWFLNDNMKGCSDQELADCFCADIAGVIKSDVQFIKDNYKMFYEIQENEDLSNEYEYAE